jgi:hypothetical protein
MVVVETADVVDTVAPVDMGVLVDVAELAAENAG